MQISTLRRIRVIGIKLILVDSLSSEQRAGIYSTFALQVDDDMDDTICCCSDCGLYLKNKHTANPKNVSAEIAYLFVKRLTAYTERFGQEPTFELAQSLFDDCFKNTTTVSE